MHASQEINVRDFFNEQRFSAYQWLIFALCFIIVLLDGFDTAAIGYIAPSLVTEWGISKPALAPVLSAALFGLAAGALGSGPMSDRWGRKRILIVSVLVFGAACLASGYASSLEALTIWRFITGLGLGAAMPNAVTLMSEFCPDNRRATLTNAMFCGFPLGAAFGGFLAAWMIPQWGWRSVLHLGGIVPLLLVVVMLLVLPESVRYMVAKAYPAEKIRRVMLRISASAALAKRFVLPETADSQSNLGSGAQGARGGLAVVLSKRYFVGSLMMWIAYFMGLVIFYAVINWMPILFKEGGLDPKTSTLIAALFPLGGVGAVLLGWFMDRFNANLIIAFGYALTAGAIYLIGQSMSELGWLVAVVFIAGTIMNTAQSSMPALAAAFYPTRARATGVSWMLGIGRFGGIAGSFLVAQLTVQQLSFQNIFAVVAIPGLIAMVALLIKQYVHPEAISARVSNQGDVIAH